VGIVAAAFVFGPTAAGLLGVSPKAIENRALSSAPRAKDGWDALAALSPWATDHLPGRAKAVHMNAWVDYNVLGQLPAGHRLGPKGMSAPTVVRGRDGNLLYGGDFTVACEKTASYEQSLQAMARLAEIVQASGRKVVFNVAPNKSSVITSDLPRAKPRGNCAARGIERQNQLLDGFEHPLFVGIRKPLAEAHASGKQVYARTDTHWTGVGAAMYAQALASHLDPELTPRLRLHPKRITKVGDLMKLAGLTSPESMTSATVSTGGTVGLSPEAATGDSAQALPKDGKWVTRPKKGLVQGRTLLLGDSFTGAALTNLRPLFAQGSFVTFSHASESRLVSEIEASDTVVIEVVQRAVVGHLCTQPQFQSRVAAALDARAT
jgi:hypothetical protein